MGVARLTCELGVDRGMVPAMNNHSRRWEESAWGFPQSRVNFITCGCAEELGKASRSGGGQGPYKVFEKRKKIRDNPPSRSIANVGEKSMRVRSFALV